MNGKEPFLLKQNMDKNNSLGHYALGTVHKLRTGNGDRGVVYFFNDIALTLHMLKGGIENHDFCVTKFTDGPLPGTNLADK